jgi:hypothetical protein
MAVSLSLSPEAETGVIPDTGVLKFKKIYMYKGSWRVYQCGGQQQSKKYELLSERHACLLWLSTIIELTNV